MKMKKDFLVILALLIFAVVGIYVSCTGTETETTKEKKINKTVLMTPGRNAIIS